MNSFTIFHSWLFACAIKPSMLLLVSSSRAIWTTGFFASTARFTSAGAATGTEALCFSTCAELATATPQVTYFIVSGSRTSPAGFVALAGAAGNFTISGSMTRSNGSDTGPRFCARAPGTIAVRSAASSASVGSRPVVFMNCLCLFDGIGWNELPSGPAPSRRPP